MITTTYKLKNFEELCQLINSGDKLVLKVNTDLSLSFNDFLKTKLEESYSNQMKYAEIDENVINQKGAFSSIIIQGWLKSLGLIGYKTLLSGYYLFANKKIKAYHPSLIDLHDMSETDHKIHGPFVLAGAFFGILHGILAKDIEKGLKTFSTIFEIPQAYKIFRFFKDSLGNKSNSQSKQKQQNIIKTELDNAYEILGVKRDSTIEEIKKARKKLMKKYHPDANPNNQEECNKYSAAINSAFDLIMNHIIK